MGARIDCDRCSARAHTTWWNDVTEKILTFCCHHSNEHADALVATQRWQLYDDDRIDDTYGDRLTGAET